MNFESIWQEYRSNLKAFIHSRVSDSDEVDDLLQNIMIKVYQKHHTVKSSTSVKSWLFQVTNNAIIDYYRTKERTPDQDQIDDDFWYKNLDITTDAGTELAQCIEPFVAALPASTAKLLKAIDINGQSQKMYAESNGLSYSTLKSRVQKGRSQLRELFTDCCHFSLDRHGNILDYTPKTENCDKC